SSENMRVVERFKRVAEDTIEYKFTVEDESTWTRPWTAALPLKKTVGPLFEHACHEGNYGLYNTLFGAPQEKKKARRKKELAKKDGDRAMCPSAQIHLSPASLYFPSNSFATPGAS